MRLKLIAAALLLAVSAAHADFAIEDADQNGVTNPQDFSWRAYVENMDRFPDRVGLICGVAYELNKSGNNSDAVLFFTECARRGNAAAMINLAQAYQDGNGVDKDPSVATEWLRRAAFSGHAAGEYEYGLALLKGEGVQKNARLGEYWLAMAAGQGDADAKAKLAELN